MRAFVSWQRARRCFPQWPAPVDAVHDAARTLADFSPDGAAIFATEGGLTLNGRPSRSAPEFESLLRAVGIAGLIIRKGVEKAELEALGGPHVELKTAERPAPAPPPSERPLEVDEHERLHNGLRHLYAAIERLRRLPPSDPGVAGSLAAAAESLRTLTNVAHRVTLSAPGGPLLVNEEPVMARQAAAAIGFLERALPTLDLRSITLWQGITPDDVDALASLLSSDDPAVVRRIREHAPFEHVAFNLRRSDDGEASFPTVDRETEILPLDPLERESSDDTSHLDLRAKFLLKAPTDRFLAPEAEVEFAPALESLNTSSSKYAARLVDRLAVYVADPDVRLRKRAMAILGRALADGKGTSRALLVVRIRPALASLIAGETEPTALESLADIARGWIAAALDGWPIQVAAEFIANDLRPRIDRDAGWRATVRARLKTIENLETAFRAMVAGPGPMREAAARVFWAVGPAATPKLIEFLAAQEDVDVRRAAAVSLRATDGQVELSKRIADDERTAIRVLSVLDAAGPLVEMGVISAVGRSEPAVRDAAFALIRRLDAKTAEPILRRTLGLEPLATIAAATKMAIAALAPDIARLAMETTSDAHAFAACSYLAACPTPAALPALKRVFEQRSRMFGFKKGLSDATRAAAVAAAAKINHPDAIPIIEAAREDRSELVRNAAR
jgi:HEAT repeat protein